jgi:hypothetical protein
MKPLLYQVRLLIIARYDLRVLFDKMYREFSVQVLACLLPLHFICAGMR